MAQVRVTVYGPAEAVQRVVNALHNSGFIVEDGLDDPGRVLNDDPNHRLLRVEVPIGGDPALLTAGAARLKREG